MNAVTYYDYYSYCDKKILTFIVKLRENGVNEAETCNSSIRL